MWELKNKFVALFVAFLIIMGGFGVGSVCAGGSTNDNSTPADYSVSDSNAVSDNSGDSNSASSSLTDDSTGTDTVDDTVIDDSTSGSPVADDNPVSDGSVDNTDDVSTDDSSDDSTDDNQEEVEDDLVNDDSADDTLADDSATDDDNSVNENPVSEGSTDVSADDNSVDNQNEEDDSTSDDNSISDGSTDNSEDNHAEIQDNTVGDDSIEDNYVSGHSDDVVNEDLSEDQSEDNTAIDDVGNEVILANDNLEDEGNLTGEQESINYPTYYEESPEPRENIQYVEKNQVPIENEQNVNVKFSESSIVNNINFKTTKASGNVTVIVEDLKSKSCLTDKTPVGDFYRAFNIWVDSGVGDIEDITIDFRIEKKWINENKIDQSTIVLNEYIDGEWVKIPVKITGENSKYIYCTAEISGYSSFAITGQKAIVNTKPEEKVKVDKPAGQTKDISSTNEPKKNILTTLIDSIRVIFNGDDPSKTTLEQPSPATTAQTAGTIEDQNLTVHFLDVGQGDSILLEFNGTEMLVDAGESDQGEIVSSYLQNQGISTLDYVVATHPHSDHIGGMNDILNNFQVEHFIDSGYPHTSETYENMLITIDQKDIPFEIVKAGQTIDFDPALDVEVLNPAITYSDELNENSIVLKVTYGETSLLLMGDAGLETEEKMMNAGYDVDSDILKVGHHASTSGSGESFISSVSPEVSIIEVGAGNEYGHPNTEVLNRLQETSNVYRTDLNGTITVTTDGLTYSVTSQKNEPVEVTQSSSSGSAAYTPTTTSTTVKETEQTKQIRQTESKETPIPQVTSTEKPISDSTKEQVTTSDTQSTPTSSTKNTDNSLIYASSKSDVYHYAGCSYIDRIKPENLITFKTRQEAEAAGYRACKKCGS